MQKRIFFNDGIRIIIIKKGIRIRVFSPIKRSKAFFKKQLNVSEREKKRRPCKRDFFFFFF